MARHWANSLTKMTTLNPPSNPELGTLSFPISWRRKLRLREDKQLVCSCTERSGRARSWTLVCVSPELKSDNRECFFSPCTCPGTGKLVTEALRTQGKESLWTFLAYSQRAKCSTMMLTAHGNERKIWGYQVKGHLGVSYVPTSQKAWESFAGSDLYQ